MYSEEELNDMQENIVYIDAFYQCLLSTISETYPDSETISIEKLKELFVNALSFYRNRLYFGINAKIENYLLSKFDIEIETETDVKPTAIRFAKDAMIN